MYIKPNVRGARANRSHVLYTQTCVFWSVLSRRAVWYRALFFSIVVPEVYGWENCGTFLLPKFATDAPPSEPPAERQACCAPQDEAPSASGALLPCGLGRLHSHSSLSVLPGTRMACFSGLSLDHLCPRLPANRPSRARPCIWQGCRQAHRQRHRE